MAKRYIVEGPDGKRYIVEGPEEGAQPPAAPAGGGGSTPAPTAAPEGSQPYLRAGDQPAGSAGVNEAVIKAALGVKQFFGGLSEDDKGVLREIEKESKEDPEQGMRLTGNIGGNVTMAALPGGAISKSVQALPKVGALMAASPKLGAAALGAVTSGGTEFLMAPGQGESYGEEIADKMRKAGSAAAIGGAVGGGLATLARPFKATTEALKLQAEKIYPTLAQGADSKIGRFIGGLTSGVLPTANRQNEEVVDAYLRRVLPGVDTAGMSTSERVGLLQHVLKGEYDTLLQGKTFKLTPTARRQVWSDAQKAAGNEPDVLAELNRRMGDVGNAMRVGNNVRLSSSNMQRQLDMIQDQINRFGTDPGVKPGEIRRGLIAAKEALQNYVRNPGLSADELAKLKALDQRYSDALRFIEAGKGVSAQQQMKASDLMRGFKSMDPKGGSGFAAAESPMQRELLEPAIRTMGLSPNQDEARAMMVALGRAGLKTAAGGAAAATAPQLAAPAYGLSLLGQTKQGSRALFGDFEAQKALARALRESGVLPATGAIVNDQE